MLKLDHLSLTVRDYRASRDWYRDVLGLEVEFEIPNANAVAMRDEFDFTIFFAAGAAVTSGCALTFQVEDVEATHARLAAAGATFVHGPQRVFWGYGAELADPDGNAVRLWDERTMREKGGG